MGATRYTYSVPTMSAANLDAVELTSGVLSEAEVGHATRSARGTSPVNRTSAQSTVLRSQKLYCSHAASGGLEERPAPVAEG